eukprot:scaffold425_cov175-Amphora_coffeaeformis.AAC.2
MPNEDFSGPSVVWGWRCKQNNRNAEKYGTQILPAETKLDTLWSRVPYSVSDSGCPDPPRKDPGNGDD